MSVTGNKGEWSELYALIKLLSFGRLYAADEDVNRIDEVYFPVLKIFRKEKGYGLVEFSINQQSGNVDVFVEKHNVKTVAKGELQRLSSYLYKSIIDGANGAFEIPNASHIMADMSISKITASSSDKTDITLQVHDTFTGYDQVCGFSIKSELGNPPTLLNASGATNFIYEINGITDADMDRINSIETSTKILDRIETINSIGKMEYSRMANTTFSANLMLVDTSMEQILATLLLKYYQNKGSRLSDLVHLLEEENPMRFPRRGFYEYKIKKFLCSVALGMMPSREWNGKDEANGGYMIVKSNGDVLVYHLYNRNAFETYLLNNTKLERGSTKRHGFSNIYKNDGKYYINLNLQIRFM